MNIEVDNVATRSSDESNRIKIIREVPLWGLISLIIAALVFGLGQAASQYLGQRQLYDLVGRQTEKIIELSAQVKQLSTQANGKDLKDMEHDLLIRDVQRRLTDVETAVNHHIVKDAQRQ